MIHFEHRDADGSRQEDKPGIGGYNREVVPGKAGGASVTGVIPYNLQIVGFKKRRRSACVVNAKWW